MGKMSPSPRIVFFLFTKNRLLQTKNAPIGAYKKYRRFELPHPTFFGVGWGKKPHPIIVIYLVTSVDLIKPPLRQEIGWTYRQKKGWLVRTTLLRYSSVFRLSFVASKLTFTRNRTKSSGASGRSPISNGVCSCDRRDNDLFLLVLIAHNIQNKNVEVRRKAEELSIQ